MTTDVTQALSTDDLEAIVGDVFAVLGAPSDMHDATGGVHSSWLEITGPGRVLMTVDADASAATAVAMAFFGEDFEDGDQQDAMKELANVCAGSCKTMLEGEWTIGIPESGTTELPADSIHATAFAGGGQVKIGLANAS